MCFLVKTEFVFVRDESQSERLQLIYISNSSFHVNTLE